MKAQQSPKVIRSAFQSVWYRVALLVFASYLAVIWFVLGPGNPAYALSVLWGTCSLVPGIPLSMTRRVPRHWFRVPEGERVLHWMIGVGVFGWLLNASGWNRRVVEPLRGSSGKGRLLSLEESSRASIVGHGICFAIHVLLATLALFSRRPGYGALWLLLPGVVVHLYPVFLQRSIMLRLQRLLVKAATAPNARPRVPASDYSKP